MTPVGSQDIVQKQSFFKKETQAQVFSCKICKIFKNKFFKEHPEETAPDSTTTYFLTCGVQRYFV